MAGHDTVEVDRTIVQKQRSEKKNCPNVFTTVLLSSLCDIVSSPPVHSWLFLYPALIPKAVQLKKVKEGDCAFEKWLVTSTPRDPNGQAELSPQTLPVG